MIRNSKNSQYFQHKNQKIGRNEMHMLQILKRTFEREFRFQGLDCKAPAPQSKSRRKKRRTSRPKKLKKLPKETINIFKSNRHSEKMSISNYIPSQSELDIDYMQRNEFPIQRSKNGISLKYNSKVLHSSADLKKTWGPAQKRKSDDVFFYKNQGGASTEDFKEPWEREIEDRISILNSRLSIKRKVFNDRKEHRSLSIKKDRSFRERLGKGDSDVIALKSKHTMQTSFRADHSQKSGVYEGRPICREKLVLAKRDITFKNMLTKRDFFKKRTKKKKRRPQKLSGIICKETEKLKQRFKDIETERETSFQKVVDKGREYYAKKYKLPVFKDKNRMYLEYSFNSSVWFKKSSGLEGDLKAEKIVRKKLAKTSALNRLDRNILILEEHLANKNGGNFFPFYLYSQIQWSTNFNQGQNEYIMIKKVFSSFALFVLNHIYVIKLRLGQLTI